MYQATPANLSAPLRAKVVASACWPDARTFTPKWPVSWMILSRSEFWSRETRIIGGSRDSEENALTVVPCGLRSMCEVTTVTGVGTRASVSRKTVASTRSYPGAARGTVLVTRGAAVLHARLPRNCLDLPTITGAGKPG